MAAAISVAHGFIVLQAGAQTGGSLVKGRL